MKNWLILFYLLVGSSAIAQSTVYQGFEADSAAEPRGGMSFLNTFIQTNLRKPIAAESKGIGGRVILTGIVEADGRIADVKVINSFRPDCDREAVRVFRLFNAWKPAMKDGKAVRQQVNIPVIFKPNAPFSYVSGERITYFGTDEKLTTDSSKAEYKQIATVDSIGLPSGDIVLYKISKKGWKEESRLPLVRKNNAYRNSAGKPVHLIGYPNSIIQREGLLISVDSTGALIGQTYFQKGKRIGTELTYYPNGPVAEKIEDFTDKNVFTSWYSTGQIRQIRVQNQDKPAISNALDQVTALWDSTGRQTIKDGTGRAVYRKDVQSYADTTRHTYFVEQGSYENGIKQGIWTGRYADGSYFYEEQYDKGISQMGKARAAGADTVRYTDIEQQPEFKGGMQGLGKFLSENLRYPVDAQRARVQGRVFISFVINTDGSVDDVQVLNGIGFGADEEAARVVKASTGRWKPGVQRGEKVRVKYNLPINFTLN